MKTETTRPASVGVYEGSNIEILLTASEAYPALEKLFLNAKTQITAGFRVFDPKTHLLSEEGRAVGKTWLDLIAHTLVRGVSIDITLSDFDPVMAHSLHRGAWEHARMWWTAAEAALAQSETEPGTLRLTVYTHPDQGGPIPRMAFSFRTLKNLRKIVTDLPDDAGRRHRALVAAPGLQGLVRNGPKGARVMWGTLPRLFPITLHHKMAVFDGETTYIGGLDVNQRRYDTPEHDRPSQETWHDLQLIVRDAAVAAEARHFLDALPAVTRGTARLPTHKSGFLATLSQERKSPILSLRPQSHARDLLSAHLAAIAGARDFIYLESQYFRDRRIARALAKAGRAHPKLRCLVTVPAAPEDAAFIDTPDLDARFGEYLQARAIRKVRRAFGERFFVTSPAQPRRPDSRDDPSERAQLGGAPIIYVHAKVSVFDDHRAIVSSANLNGRSMGWDAEAGIVFSNREVIADLKSRLFAHWLGEAAPVGDTAALFDMWCARALSNARVAPTDRQGFLLPYDLKAADGIALPMPGAPEEMV